MDKDKNKGLADSQEGEFVLNESGTSVSIDPNPDTDFSEDDNSDANKVLDDHNNEPKENINKEK